MKKAISLILLILTIPSYGKVIECENSHSRGSRIKIELLGSKTAKATVDKNGAKSKYFLRVLSKTRTGVFFKTDSGNILKLAAIEESLQLSQTANAFDVNFESAKCRI